MIISASYRTDIPALYGAWFRNRLKAGFASSINPYNGKSYEVSLDPKKIDGFVFWTRNASSFGPVLADLQKIPLPFIVQYTITGYPRFLDRYVPGAKKMISVFKQISSDFGQDSIVWRYDPIIWTTKTDFNFHLENFSRLAEALYGFTNEVVISFVHYYSKTRRNLDRAARLYDFEWVDPNESEKKELLLKLAEIARKNNFSPTVCAQPHLLSDGIFPARCIDANRLNRIAIKLGSRAIKVRERGNRPSCQCHESRDIGIYETCLHGCAYCYAVDDWQIAKENCIKHNHNEEMLFTDN